MSGDQWDPQGKAFPSPNRPLSDLQARLGKQLSLPHLTVFTG